MNRRALARVGAGFAVLGGLLLSLGTLQFLIAIPHPTSGETLGNFTNDGPLLMIFTVLSFVRLVAPLAVLIGLLGLYLLLDASPLARGGLAIAAVAMLLLFALPILPYGYVFGLSGNPPSIDTIEAMILFSSLSGVLQALLLITGLGLLYAASRRARVLGTWRPLLLTIGLLSVLASTVVLVLPAIGLDGGPILFEASRFASGLLWIALGVAVWRHASLVHHHNTTTGAAPANL